ncbi:Gfo/Idh/MocA family protein [Chloroflexota bacterium]
MTIGWGIIGIGSVSEYQIAPALSKVANTELVAICDCDVTRVKNFAAQHDVEGVYDSYEKMLKDPQVDVVYIGTPNHLHAQQTIMAAEAGKHVLCEKPMALTVADCEHMIEACKKHNVKLAIDFQNRFSPAVVQARRLIADGKIGEIVVARAQGCHFAAELAQAPNYPGAGRWRMNAATAGAGALMGVGVHYFDLLRYILSSEVEDVIAVCEPQGTGILDDMEYAILKFANGTRGLVITGVRLPRSDNGVILYGMKAKVTCKVYRGQDELLVEGDSINEQASYHSPDSPQRYTPVIEHLNECITEDTEPIISGRDGLEMVKLTNAILESSRTRKEVKIS